MVFCPTGRMTSWEAGKMFGMNQATKFARLLEDDIDEAMNMLAPVRRAAATTDRKSVV